MNRQLDRAIAGMFLVGKEERKRNQNQYMGDILFLLKISILAREATLLPTQAQSSLSKGHQPGLRFLSVILRHKLNFLKKPFRQSYPFVGPSFLLNRILGMDVRLIVTHFFLE